MINTKKQKIVYIGAGNVAFHFVKILAEHFDIIQIYSRNIENAELLAKKFNCKFTNNISEIDRTANIYFISLKDDIIEEVLKKFNFKIPLSIHTSGSIDINILQPFSENFGVIYPLQTFSKNAKLNLTEIPLFIEANNKKTHNSVKQIAGCISKKTFNCSTENRQLLHIAGVFSNNFTNYLFLLTKKLLKKTEYDFDVLKPLITETLNKAISFGPENSQTGPAIRNDLNIINKHLEILKNYEDCQKMYRFVTESIIKENKEKNNDKF
ncbi:MAG: hypothetical protein A2046_04630 [Bacteroidetes bacterium GWA2_30_7]|nr:MAG: hypothetical protein A2046_04630 [Bacteroidetes bacterium GWA2_30_7]